MRTKTQRWLFVGIVLGMVGAIAFYKFYWEGPTPTESGKIGQVAPQFELVSADGQSRGSEELEGRPYLLTFFSSWCFSCQMEHKILGNIARQSDMYLVGVAFQDTQEAIFNWLSRFGNPFSKVAFDKSGLIGHSWGITGVPETFLVDKNGVIRAHVKGAIFSDENIAYIQNAIKKL